MANFITCVITDIGISIIVNHALYNLFQSDWHVFMSAEGMQNITGSINIMQNSANL